MGQGSSARAGRAWVAARGPLLAVAAALALAACGTDVKQMMQRDSETFWQDQHIVRLGEAEGLAQVQQVYAAEAAKEDACTPITEAAGERMAAGHASYWGDVWAGMRESLVALVPVPSVERCAEAHRRYASEIRGLCRRLGERGHELDCPEPGEF